jgi:DNA-binding protein HU-beta
VNKAELIETLSKRLGDRKTATAALESVVEEIQRAVQKGERVAITGFGVFEKRVRNARTARNPRTGEAVKVKKTSVPAFRPGQGFKDVITGAKKLAKAPVTAATNAARGTRATATKSTATNSTAKATPAKKTAAKSTAKATPAKKTAAKSTPAKKTAAKSTAKATPAKKTAAKSTAKATPAKKAPAKKTAAKKAPATKRTASR